MDLFNASAADINRLMEATTDIEVQRLLAKLQFAKSQDDVEYEDHLLAEIAQLSLGSM